MKVHIIPHDLLMFDGVVLNNVSWMTNLNWSYHIHPIFLARSGEDQLLFLRASERSALF